MKKILLAYDGGEPARRALEQTIELATAFDAAVGRHQRRAGRTPAAPGRPLG